MTLSKQAQTRRKGMEGGGGGGRALYALRHRKEFTLVEEKKLGASTSRQTHA